MSSREHRHSTNFSKLQHCASGSRNCQQCSVWKQILSSSDEQAFDPKLIEIVEGCAGCQQAIQESSDVNLEWWNEARQSWLESEIPDSTTNDQSRITLELCENSPDRNGIEIERVSLEFLGPPTHPELLGRLGRYDVLKVVGRGGMGVVLKAFDNELHRVVAIKTLADHLASNASARRRFAREAQAAAAVIHPNVIPIFNVESEFKTPYLVMQYVGGGSLQSKVEAEGPLPVEATLRIAKQTAAALSAAHEQGLVHRDVKPANILLEENVERVLLSDFGLARAVDDASLTHTGVVAGTPHYMSPEQAMGESIHCSSDQFSLGSVIYYMLTGHSPFRASTAMGVLNRICHSPHRPINELNSRVPVQVSQLVDQLLSKKPEDRFDSLNSVEREIDSLLHALQSGGLSLRAPMRKTVGALVASHQRMLAVLALILLLLASGWELSSRLPELFSASPAVVDSDHETDQPQPSNQLTVKDLRRVQQLFEQSRAEDLAFEQELNRTNQQARFLEAVWTSSGQTSTNGSSNEYSSRVFQIGNDLNLLDQVINPNSANSIPDSRQP